MGVFQDYLNTYSDLANAYKNQNANTTNKFGQSVLNVNRRQAYLKKAGAWDQFQKDAQNKNWEHYVWTGGSPAWSPGGKDSDLEKEWKKYSAANPGASKAEWGKNHWNTYGKNENRTVPFNGLGTVLWGEHQYTVKHAQLYNNGIIPEIYTKPDGTVELTTGAEDWGKKHWENSGKNETRILPGAKFTLDKNGNLGLASYPGIGSPIGKGLQQNYSDIIKVFNQSKGGNYKGLMEGLQKSLTPEAFNDLVSSGDLNSISSFYQKNKVQAWDASKLGAQPPTGGFDAKYYSVNTAGGKKAIEEWNKAQSSVNVGGVYLPDLDIVGKYNKDTYLHWYYTTQGKPLGERGNAPTAAELTEKYKEFLTDAEYQKYRDEVLGLSEKFDNIAEWADAQDPDALAQWYQKLPSDQKQQYDDGTLPVPTLDNIPDSLKDKLTVNKGTTVLEGSLSSVLGPKEEQKQKMFGALTQDSLKAAADELQKQKLKEQEYDFFKGLPGVDEILSINQSISNSILGDIQAGGVLGWMGNEEDIGEKLEKSLFGATGVKTNSNAVYNWQQWFEDQLLTKYEGGAIIADPFDPSVTYEVDADFAKNYIDNYLKPRFDTSSSMSEFISYMDVKQNEQNIFQTQSALSYLKDIADLKAKTYLDAIKAQTPLGFDADFYWNPEGNFSPDEPKYQTYLKQKEELVKDWELAKTKGNTEKVPGTDWTWNQWAYHYGLNINDKNEFAKLHYQVKGAAQGFDPAKDLITYKQAQDYIDTTILPAIADEKLNIGDTTFMNFITPEEFADAMIEGISPGEQKEEWDKLLETLGLSGKDMGIDEVKQYIIDAFSTGEALKIKESIKYLNEKKQKPTQEKLGVDYIEKPEDYQPTDDPDATQLYKIFQNAGYQGSEEDFYTDFMPDVSKGDMELITQATKGFETSSVFSGLTSSDPFESVFSMEKLFADEDTFASTKEDDTAPSYFKMFEDDEDTDYKSKSGQKVLGEFTSLFKGFS